MGKKINKRYWRKHLLPNEKLLHTFGVSRWYLFLFYIFPGLIILGAVVYSFQYINVVLASILLLIPIIFLFPAWVLASFTKYAISNHRILSRVGFLHKRLSVVDLKSITDVHIHEGFFERLLTRSGIIAINTAGSDRIELLMRHVSSPFERRQDIYKHQHSLNGKN